MRGCFSWKRSRELLHVSGFLDPLLHGRNFVEMYSTALSLQATCACWALELWLVCILTWKTSQGYFSYWWFVQCHYSGYLGLYKNMLLSNFTCFFFLCWEWLRGHLELPPGSRGMILLGSAVLELGSWILKGWCSENVFSCLSCLPQGWEGWLPEMGTRRPWKVRL